MFTAVVRITGAGRLADFRERLRWLLVRDPDAEDYTEHHVPGVLEYRFEPKKGLPFPELTTASAEFPELRVEAQWDHDGVRGRAVFENGRVVEDEAVAPQAAGIAIATGDDGRLELALICERHADEWIGYAASADRHSYFCWRDGALTLVEPDDADEALEEVAFRLSTNGSGTTKRMPPPSASATGSTAIRCAARTSSRRSSPSCAATAALIPPLSRTPPRCAPH